MKKALFMTNIDYFMNPLMTSDDLHTKHDIYLSKKFVNLHTKISTMSNFSVNFIKEEIPHMHYQSLEAYKQEII